MLGKSIDGAGQGEGRRRGAEAPFLGEGLND
jgi:hypothetical protein